MNLKNNQGPKCRNSVPSRWHNIHVYYDSLFIDLNVRHTGRHSRMLVYDYDSYYRSTLSLWVRCQPCHQARRHLISVNIIQVCCSDNGKSIQMRTSTLDKIHHRKLWLKLTVPTSTIGSGCSRWNYLPSSEVCPYFSPLWVRRKLTIASLPKLVKKHINTYGQILLHAYIRP